ncbi:MAG: diguanylate cyclase [Coriobacteriales bacterium]|jgi:diguanylate cyclase (GGDEF)-like protein|nr:diguanylate cyclase [Coriobacteriales bacterium]
MDPVAQIFFDYLRDVIYRPEQAELDPEEVPEGFRDLAKGLLYYVHSVREASTLASDIARGDLSTSPLSPGNEVAANLKSLQASLRHLTWQMQQVAAGDFSQRVSFMGDFASAVNHMIEQLEQRRSAYVAEIESGHERNRELLEISYNDEATNTYNRRFGMEKLVQWLDEGRNFSICFIDLDNLKYVNDEFGHNEGDVYILMVTDLLRQFAPEGLVCRLGGDEFMILADGWAKDAALRRLSELRSQLLAENDKPDNQYHHSMSYGVVEIDESNRLSSSDLLSLADERMYDFKRAHKAERKVY